MGDKKWSGKYCSSILKYCSFWNLYRRAEASMLNYLIPLIKAWKLYDQNGIRRFLCCSVGDIELNQRRIILQLDFKYLVF